MRLVACLTMNSDRAIAEELTGAWLPCQERSASHKPARSNYPLNAEFPRPPRLAADARPQPSVAEVGVLGPRLIAAGRWRSLRLRDWVWSSFAGGYSFCAASSIMCAA
jgi:hypothetical protein